VIDDGEDDTAPARLAEQITRRLQAGELVDPDDCARQNPAWADSIRGLLPTLNDLTELGRSLARRRRRRRARENTSHEPN
jgi:hypothetical protein